MTLKTNFMLGILSGGGGFILKAASTLFLVPLFIHYLGTQYFGFYVFLLSFSDLLGLMDAGLTSALIQRMSHHLALNDQNGVREQLCIGQWLYGGITVLLILFGMFGSPFISHVFHLPAAFHSIAVMTTFLMFFESAANLYGWFFQSILKSHNLYQWTNIADTFRAIAANLVSVVLLMLGYDLIAIFTARLVVTILTVICLIFKTVQIEPGTFQRKVPRDLKGIKVLFEISFYAMLQRTSVFISLKMDDFVIAAFLTLTDLGIYALVFRLYSQLIQFCIKIMEGIFPIFTRFSSLQAHERNQFFFVRMSAFITYTVTALLFLLLFHYPELIHFMGSGKINPNDAFPLSLVISGIVWNVIVQFPASQYLFASGRHRYLSLVSIGAALLNFMLSILLVKKIGLIGVALGTLLPQMAQYQAFTIGYACRCLSLPMKHYGYSVYFKNLPPLTGLFILLVFSRWLSGWTHPKMSMMILSSALSMLLSAIGWLFYTASDYERNLIFSKLNLHSPAIFRKIIPLRDYLVRQDSV